MPQRIVPLKELDVHWLPDPRQVDGRWGTGLGFLCPEHRDHRIFLYFRNPVDGGVSIHLQMLYDVDHVTMDNGDPFQDISVFPIGNDSEPIRVPCGSIFWVVGGSCILNIPRWWKRR